jgi:dihydrofolate reductase
MFPRFRMIAAMTANNGIGFCGKMPWEMQGITLLDDLKHFRILTSTQPNIRKAVVMGYNTWLSLPEEHKPLKNRTNYVLSRSKCTETYTMRNINQCVEHAIATNHNEVWVIGGKQVYQQFFDKNLIQDLWITRVNQEFESDCFFPEIPKTFKKKHSFDVINSEYKTKTKFDTTINLTFERWINNAE